MSVSAPLFRNCISCKASLTFKRKIVCGSCNKDFCIECVLKQQGKWSCIPCFKEANYQSLFSEILSQLEENRKREEEDNELECPICFEFYKNAVETICGHGFCEFCINRCVERSLHCPVCKANPSPIHPSFPLRSLVSRKVPTQAPPKVDEGLSQIHRERGNLEYREGRTASAIESYHEALRFNPNDYSLYANKAAAYIKLEQFHMALDSCRECLMLNAGFVKVILRKGICLENLGLLGGSRDAFLDARQHDRTGEWKGQIDANLARVVKKLTS